MSNITWMLSPSGLPTVLARSLIPEFDGAMQSIEHFEAAAPIKRLFGSQRGAMVANSS